MEWVDICLRDNFLFTFKEAPLPLFLVLLVFFCICAIAFFVTQSYNKAITSTARLLLLEYIISLIVLTLITRSGNHQIGHNFIPFWSYAAIINENQGALFVDNVLNLIVFLPIGVLLGCGYKNIKWQKELYLAAGLSICIEILQFIFKRGFSEVDDVIHNTLGCMIGFGIYKSIAGVCKFIVKKKAAV